MREMRLAILFSGNGSNLENIYKKMQGMELNSSLGASFALGENFGEQQTQKSSFIPKISSKYKTSTANTRIFDLVSANQTQNAKSALDSANLAKIKLNFALAISSKESAFGITRCANLGLKCEVVDYKQHKENFIPQIIALLEKNQIDLVVLAGFMRILPPTFTAKFRAINIHPSILPLFKGANAIKESFDSDMKIAGVSVHFVSDELDSGALIAQDIIHKIEGESFESFEARIHELEYEIYPKAIIKAVQILCNSVLGMQFRTCGNFQASTDSSLVESPKISTNTKATPQSLRLRFCESQNLSENQAKNAESALDSAKSTKDNE